jgi:hypothetical protein
MGCGSSKDRGASSPPARYPNPDRSSGAAPTQTPATRPPTEYHNRPSASSSGHGFARPQSGPSYGDTRHPSTSQRRVRRPSTQGDGRWSSRAPYGNTSRPSSSHRRPSSSSTGSHRRPATSSHASSRLPQNPPRQSSRPQPIPEDRPVQYTDDRVIIGNVSTIITFIDQHAENFYRRDVLELSSPNRELSNPRSRNAAIRQYFARVVIGSIIMVDRQLYDSRSIREITLHNLTETQGQIQKYSKLQARYPPTLRGAQFPPETRRVRSTFTTSVSSAGRYGDSCCRILRAGVLVRGMRRKGTELDLS